MEENWILIRYGEIGLKSDWVRKEFEDRLMDNIRSGLEGEGIDVKMKRGYGRIFVRAEDSEEVREVLKRTFGVVSFSPCVKMETDLENIVEEMGEVGEEEIQEKDKFAVRARRTGDHSFTSKDIEREVGSEIIERTDAEVDLDNPEKIIYAEVRQGQTYIFTEKIDGPGGLPLGTQGKVVSLFKGDCESFLAAWLMMKRGCSVVLLHGDLEPYRSEEKFEGAEEALQKWSHGSDLEVRKFDLGDEIFKFQESEEELTCILCRRLLVGIADQIALEEDAKAIVSGETSQGSFRTFQLEDSKTDLPVLRPLIGLSEDEIREKCKDIGGNFLLEREKCKASVELESGITEREVREVEEEMDFEEKIKEIP